MGVSVLLVGDGAREHAIAERLSEDADVYAIMSRNNPGIRRIAKDVRITNVKEPVSVKEAAEGMDVSFDVGFVSPDPCLAAGVTDALTELGIPMASPTKAAARIEWDKAFARRLMDKYRIAGLPKYSVAESWEKAKEIIEEYGDVAVKPVGLTGGKGVKLTGEHLDINSAVEYAKELISRDGAVVLEEKLVGEEFTLQVFSDGKRIVVMPPVQDHKRLLEGDRGPNTGGMGSYSTGNVLPFLTESDVEEATKILKDTVWAMAKEGHPFVGVLYGQFMAVKDGVKVVEFNSRFGDPEAMNVLSVLNDSLSDVFLSMSDGNVSPVRFYEENTIVKYLVPDGYPTNPKRDEPIEINEELVKKEGANLYYASVYEENGVVYTTSSRSLAVVSVSDSLEFAEASVENAITHIHGKLYHRRDIGKSDLIKKRVEHMKRVRGA